MRLGKHRGGPDAALRRLYVEQALGWSLAWWIGVGSLFTIAVATHGRLAQRDLDADLELMAVAVYGLSWLDDDGVFHDEILRSEELLEDNPFDLWVIETEPRDIVHLGPESATFEVESLDAIVDGILGTEADDHFSDGIDARGVPYRLHGITFYDESDVPRGAILVVGDPALWRSAHAKFIRETALATLGLAVVGLLVGMALSRRALRPVVDSLAQQKRFLAAAAHELRTPVASLRAVCEAAADGA